MATEYTNRRGKPIADPSRCKASVSGKGQWGWLHQHQCKRKPWKDGWCRQHHPDTENVRYEERKAGWRREEVALAKKYEQDQWLARLPAIIAKLLAVNGGIMVGVLTPDERADIDRCEQEGENT